MDVQIFTTAGSNTWTKPSGALYLIGFMVGGGGSGQRIVKESGGRSAPDDPNGDFWHNRQGFGLSSAMITFTENAAYCCKEGVGMAGVVTAGGIGIQFPAGKGSMEQVPKQETGDWMGWTGNPKRYPFLFPNDSNLAWGCQRGLETWSGDAYPGFREKCFPRFTAVHCRTGIETDDHFETTIEDAVILGDWSQNGSVALDQKTNYRFGTHYLRCEIRGHEYVYRYANDSDVTEFLDCTLECPKVFAVPDGNPSNRLGSDAREIRLLRCKWDMPTVLVPRGRSLASYPHILRFAKNQSLSNTNRTTTRTLRTYVKPWIDSKDYQVYWDFQRASFALPAIPATDRYDDWPAGVNTHAQLIAQGTPIYGDVIPETAVQRVDFGPLLWVNDITRN